MDVSIRPSTYQKVKADLHLYTFGLLVVISFFLYSFLLPAGQKRFFATIFGIISPIDFVGGTVFTLIVIGVSFASIFLFEVHDKVYDKHIVRWRYYYDLDYVIPTLVRPFANKVDKRFFDYARDNRYDFMKQLFYPFVADGVGEYRIEENYRVRFYEGALKYWITQINELVLFLLGFQDCDNKTNAGLDPEFTKTRCERA